MENANVENHLGNQFEMAASSALDIPESKSDYCPCNRCTVARKQGRQEIVNRVLELHKPSPRFIGERIPCLICKEDMPCQNYTSIRR
jgi:hypothetical protein